MKCVKPTSIATSRKLSRHRGHWHASIQHLRLHLARQLFAPRGDLAFATLVVSVEALTGGDRRLGLLPQSPPAVGAGGHCTGRLRHRTAVQVVCTETRTCHRSRARHLGVSHWLRVRSRRSRRLTPGVGGRLFLLSSGRSFRAICGRLWNRGGWRYQRQLSHGHKLAADVSRERTSHLGRERVSLDESLRQALRLVALVDVDHVTASHTHVHGQLEEFDSLIMF